jgi:enoyl-CoA hydratase/carnithine racemase
MKLAEYQTRFETIRFERREGILQMAFHTNGGPLEWDPLPHREWAEAFGAVANDPDNRVVIMTGCGEAFVAGPPATPRPVGPVVSPEEWEPTRWHGMRIIMNLLSIEAPVIAAINGPALRHPETPLLSDIVLAAEHAKFQNIGHFLSHVTPGDGMHVVMPLLMGLNRGRYFLLTGQTLSALEAKEIGLVNEVLPAAELLPRAWELAEELAKRPPLVLRYTRLLLTQQIRREMHDLLGYGLALEGLALGAAGVPTGKSPGDTLVEA